MDTINQAFPLNWISLEKRKKERRKFKEEESKRESEQCLLSFRYWTVVGVASIYRGHRNHCYFIVNGNAPA